MGQHPALLRVLCGSVASPTGVLGQPLCLEWQVPMALAPGSSSLPGFPPSQVTEFHLEGKCFFCSLVPAVCHEHSDLLSHQNIRHNPWQAPMCFQRLEGEKHVKLGHFWVFWAVQTQFHKERRLKVKTPPQEEFPCVAQPPVLGTFGFLLNLTVKVLASCLT